MGRCGTVFLGTATARRQNIPPDVAEVRDLEPQRTSETRMIMAMARVARGLANASQGAHGTVGVAGIAAVAMRVQETRDTAGWR
jgi:hypothetical protein